MKPLFDPKVDFVFKKIFGNEKHPNILISFLNAVIKSDDKIKTVKLMETDINPDSIEDMVCIAESTVGQCKAAETGDRYVITAGVPFGQAGTTNIIRVEKLG